MDFFVTFDDGTSCGACAPAFAAGNIASARIAATTKCTRKIFFMNFLQDFCPRTLRAKNACCLMLEEFRSPFHSGKDLLTSWSAQGGLPPFFVSAECKGDVAWSVPRGKATSGQRPAQRSAGVSLHFGKDLLNSWSAHPRVFLRKSGSERT